jgi:anti-sigma factor RsiW
MTCEQTELDLLAYLADELDAAEAAKVRDHIASCPACAAEAASLRSISQHLSQRLKEIPPALDVPPLVSARIERALQAERRRAKRSSWWSGLTVVAAAAAAVLASFAVKPDLAESVAEVPVVGLVATPFLQPDYEVQLATAPPSTAASVGAAERSQPNATATANGVKVVMTRIERQPNQTKVWYRAEGAKLLPGADLKAYLPEIQLRRVPPPQIYRMTADQRGDDVLFIVTFEAIPGKVHLTLKGLPLEGLPAQQDSWILQEK